MNKQAEFDALGTGENLFVSRLATHPVPWIFFVACENKWCDHDEYVAPDGEEYYVMALYFRGEPLGQRQGHLQLQGAGR